MFKKAKGVTGFMAEMSEKAGPLNAMAYMILRGVGTRKKGGAPKNEGTSDDVYENKGKKTVPGTCVDVYENKQLNRFIRRCI